MIWATSQNPDKPSEKLVLLALADHYNWETKQCNPGLARLVDWTGISRRSILEHLSSLERQGYIERTRNWRHNGSQTSNIYRLPRMEAWGAMAVDNFVDKSNA